MPTKSQSPAQNATKPTKASAKPTVKKATPAKTAPTKKWTAAVAKPTAPKPVAKPLSPFQQWAATEGAFDEFIGFVLDGGHMADFCKKRETPFPYTTMYDWVRSDDRRAEMYARAREDRAEKFADEIVAISDEIEVSTKHQGDDVVLVLDAAAVSRNKLRVDARKWIASKLKPRIYGDRVQVEQTVDHRGLPDDALLMRLAAFGIQLPGIVPVAPTEGEG